MDKSTTSFAPRVEWSTTELGTDSDDLFFFMDEQAMPVQLQGAGVKGQRRLRH